MNNIRRGDPLEEETLVTLLHRAQTNMDPEAFDGLYLLYADRIFRFLLARLGNEESAEEITSEFFVHLIERIDKYRIAPKDNVAIFSAWLFRMAHNKMVDILRVKKRTTHVSIEHAASVPEGSRVLEEVEERLDFQGIVSKLQLLNEQQRQVITLRFIEGLNIAETAQVMQKSEGAIKALQHRSLQSLRRYLQQ